MIRWLGANVVHLSYFSNFGCSARSWVSDWVLDQSQELVRGADRDAAACAVGRHGSRVPVTIPRQGSDVIHFTAMKVAGPPAWLALPVIFLLVVVVLAGPAEMVGRCFGGLEALTAYRYDLIGSLLGIGVFTLMSFLRAPSVVWELAVSLVFLVLATGLRMRVASAVSGGRRCGHAVGRDPWPRG